MKKTGTRKKNITTTGRSASSNNGQSRLIEVEDGPMFTAKELFGSKYSAQATTANRKRAATIIRSDRYKNIEEGIIPYSSNSPISTVNNISPRDSVVLCQKAYYNFANFRNTIDIMTEFSVGKIFLKGGTAKSRSFFNQYFSKLNIFDLQDRFFREFYRSGNCFLYPLEGDINSEDIRNLSRVFELNISNAANVSIPIRYILINPAEIEVIGASAFNSPEYLKVLSNYELSRLRSPRTKEDKEIYNNLPTETKEQIKKSKNSGDTHVSIPLNLEKVTAVFYKKQDYEPFAVPMGFPVLEDINWKSEMKKIDMAITRTAQQAILLVTMGETPRDGGMGVNQAHIAKVKTFFENESVARVLVADYTTKAEFVIPNIGSILDPSKYQQVNEDIREGLNNLLIGTNDKFANANAKIEVFIERLRHSREVFITQFLIPEIRKIGSSLNLKSLPVPYFKEIDMKDRLEFTKIYTRLLELGVLTPKETLMVIEEGKLPSWEESQDNQKEFKELKDTGLYEPITGGTFTQKETLEMKNDSALKIRKEAGRPAGTKSKQTTKKVKPIGASISAKKIMENLRLFDEINASVEKEYRNVAKIKRFTNEHKNIVANITNIIASNEEPENWKNVIKEYVKSPLDTNQKRVNEIINIAEEHGLDIHDAAILYASRK